MRLRGQVVAGFYAAPEKAITMMAAEYLIPPARKCWSLLDPCAGKGAALAQLGKILKAPPSKLYAIELNDSRADDVRAAVPEGQVLAPASIFGCWATLDSFSCVFLNPPFDNSPEGERVELQFLRRATDLLMPHGILCLVIPESQIDDTGSHYAGIPVFLREHYESVQVVPFPADARPFNEVVVFGVKRKAGADKYQTLLARPGTQYHIPAGTGPWTWKKVEPTDAELASALAASPLRARWQEPAVYGAPSPPLALSIGHVALLLASGQLDGIVEENGHAHVVRGTSRKKQYVADVQVLLDDKGNETGTKTIMREKIELIVRTVDLGGVVRTYGEEPVEEEAAEETAA